MSTERVSVLIVEDEVLVAMMTKNRLETQGYLVYDSVTTGKAAVESAARNEPDIIFMDIRLPGEMDGIDAAEAILAHRRVPIVFVTGYSDPEILERAQAAGPAAILAKPASPQQFIATIEATLLRTPPDAAPSAR